MTAAPGPLAPHIETRADAATLAETVADWLLKRAMAKAGAISLCLSGGSTPKTLYERLASPPYRDSFPWARTHLFFGDERFVPQDDDRSNLRMVREALLSKIPLPESQIHAIPTEDIAPGASALAYETTLKTFYGADELDAGRPLFDVVLLGLGPDGHTASLFPGTSILTERTRWVSDVIGPKSEPRITLTYPALESTAAAAFLIAGEEKRAILRRTLSGDLDLPATRLRPRGELIVFTDIAACPGRAQKLPQV